MPVSRISRFADRSAVCPVRVPHALTVVVALIMAYPLSVYGQTSANATVSADVQQPLSVTKTNDLAFGNVFPGLDKSVAVTEAAAAAFSIAGQAGASVNLTFTAPATIASGGNTMPIANWVGRHNTTNSSASGTDFTPSAVATSATLSGTGALFVFVGATAQPAANQPAGAYSGTLTLTVVYF